MDNDPPHITSIRQLNIGKPVEERLMNVETQLDVHSSRFESERGTRSRAHQALHERLDRQDGVLGGQDKRLIRIERLIWGCGGAAILLEVLPKIRAFIIGHP